MDSKLRKSLGILAVVMLMIALAFLFNNCEPLKPSIDSTTLKSNGYFDLKKNNTKLTDSENYSLRLNAKELWNKKDVSTFNTASSLYKNPNYITS